jgi:hypothetical protein
MSLYTQFQTDESLEKTGILLEYGETAAGKPICIRIARAGGANKQYEKRLEAATKPIRRQLQNETAESAQLVRILRKVYAETVVLGWENVEDRDGKPIPFTVDNCIQLFTDLPDLFMDVQEQSRRAALFKLQVREDDAKN